MELVFIYVQDYFNGYGIMKNDKVIKFIFYYYFLIKFTYFKYYINILNNCKLLNYNRTIV